MYRHLGIPLGIALLTAVKYLIKMRSKIKINLIPILFIARNTYIVILSIAID